MSKFTPGPWKCGTEEPFVYALNDAGANRFFCAVQPGWVTTLGGHTRTDQRTAPEEMQANARLIAAAPDGFAAAERAYLALLTLPHAGPRLTREFQAAMSVLRSFIAKATGCTDEEVQNEYEERARALLARIDGGGV